MRNLLDFRNYTPAEIEELLDRAAAIKANPEKFKDILAGKKLYMLFEKTSTRTFLSFSTGMTELGGTYYNQLWEQSNFVLGDTISELRYVGRNVDIIMARLKRNEMVELMGKNTTVPFINGCDNSFHPCQALADLLKVKEQFGTLAVNFLYIGAKNNVVNSLVDSLPRLGGKLYSLTPIVNDTGVPEEFYEKAKETGNYVEIDPSISMEELKKIVKDMDVLYTDTWVDMEFFNNPAFAKQKEETIAKMMPYQINDELLEGSKAIVLHDMPMHIGYEISQSVVDKNLDHILDQAENRRHVEKAVMVTLLEDENTKKYFGNV